MKFGHQLSRFLIQSFLLAALLGGLLAAAPARAQSGSCGTCTAFSLPAFLCAIPGTLTTGTACPSQGPATPDTICTNGFPQSQRPHVTGPTLVPVSIGGGQFKVRLLVHIETPFNSTAGNGALQVFWNAGATATSPTIDFCNQGVTDISDTYLEFGTFTCANVPQTVGTYSLRAQMMQGLAGNCCTPRSDLNGMVVTVTPQLLGCPIPPKDDCDHCNACKLVKGGGANVGGKGGQAGPGHSGPGAFLSYHAGGVGFTGFPGTAAWKPTLGRYWSHNYAERIVIDPVANNDSHVWLLTRKATFREFSNKQADGRYATVSPTDEYRKLYRTAAGWDLHELDGTVHHFDNSGVWLQSVDRNGNAKTATYDANGKLSMVTFADGRNETFTYYSGGTGKLATITEVGVGGAASRVWHYTWSASNTGDDLLTIGRPDGTSWAFTYGNALLAGYLTTMELVGTDGSRRVETAWEYDAQGNVVKIWSGAASYTDANAVEKWAFSFDNPLQPTVTQVTDPLGNVATYKYDRDTNSDKTRVTEIDGDCPSCGAGPQPKFYYDDANNPLRPTRMTDSRGTTTVFTYNSDGLLTEKTEAMGTPLERTTTLEYNGPFPALVTRVERPSTSGTGVQATVSSYDGVGNEISNTLSGIESGSAFNYSTVTTYNGAGEPLTVDPPGNGTSDVTSYTYDASRGNLLALTRTEPLIGQTGFSYDAFNRLTATVDPNAVSTETIFDLLDRATSIAQRGATPAEDLVTTRTYNAFGDLFRITLPLGNVVEYGYDGSGRLVSVERKPNAGSSGERAVFTLDGFGHHTHEELQRWSGSAWITDSTSDFVYSTRCHLDKAIHPDGSVTEYAYDCEGNPERVWDAKHPSANQTQPATQLNTYDLLNRVSSVTQPWGGSGGGTAITRYVFDAQDHATQVTDANGTVTSFTYSDRNLLTRSSSETSGITTYTFNEHGAQVSRTDARNVTVTQTFDALDRVVFVDYPENNLDMTYTYDDPAVPFSKDRLTAVTRNGQTTPYRYDRFGRILQDGGLTYSYDKNGNRQTLGYPGNVSAALTFDFADRPATLSMQDAAGPVQSLVSSSTHKAFGPLDSLALGNGLIESRGFTSRYFPSAISVPGRLDWTYTTDALGNVTAIADNLNGGGSRSFAYQDMQYFLTQGNGPWGTRTWTYGKSGDRLSETRDSVSRAYTYTPNAAGGNSSRLAQITGGASGTASFFSDPAGDITFHSEGTAKLRLTYDSDQQLAQQRAESDTTAQGLSQFTYDSRDFLSSSRLFSFAGSAAPDREVLATYDSQGTLHHREDLQHRSPSAPRNQPEIRDDGYIFYFAERPVAIYDKNLSTPVAGSPSLTTTLTYLTTDAVGAPILATDTAGTTRWQGGFEPFGADWNGAGASGLFLRLPGQWDDPAWKSTNLFYNLNRWYDSGTGRYTRPDPLPELSAVVPYSFALSNPMRYQDRNGLQALPKPLPPMVDPVPPLHLVPPPTTCVPEEAAAMGLGAMLSAGLTVILDELFFDPASAGEKGLDDLTDSRCKPKCGDCDPAEHRILQDAVDRICQSPRKCSAGMSPAQLQAYYTANVACYFARKEVNERCYRGGDAGHRQQQDDARRAALRCLDVMTGGKR